MKPSQTSSNEVNYQDARHKVEHLTDSFVVAATHSLTDSEILARQDYSETISHRDDDNTECYQQQMEAIQDNCIHKQEQLKKYKAKEEKANSDAEVRRIEDQHHRDR